MKLLAKRMQSEIKHNTHPFLKAYRRKVSFILSDLNSWERDSKKLFVPPERNFSMPKINQSTNHITIWPLFAISFVFTVPLLNSVSVVGKRMNIVANTIVRIKDRLELTPPNLCEPVAFQCYFVIKKFFENSCVCSYWNKWWLCLNVKQQSFSLRFTIVITNTP